MNEFNLTPAQIRFLMALYDAPRIGLPGAALAAAAGYAGRMHQPGGGAARAPMWTGRVFARMPEGLARVSFDDGITRYSLTERGFAVACRLAGEKSS